MNLDRSPFFRPFCARCVRNDVSVDFDTFTVQRIVSSIIGTYADKRLYSQDITTSSTPLPSYEVPEQSLVMLALAHPQLAIIQHAEYDPRDPSLTELCSTIMAANADTVFNSVTLA